MAYVWEPGSVRGDNAGMKVLRAITSHWQWSGIVTAQTGFPDTIVTGADSNHDLNAFNDRPNIANASLASGDFNRYAAAAAGTLGNLGRNTYVGPNEWYWDMSIQRRIPLKIWKLESQALTFRAEFFNTLNHANHGLPSLNLASGPSTTPGDGGFGDLVSTVTGQRQIKIYIKYSF